MADDIVLLEECASEQATFPAVVSFQRERNRFLSWGSVAATPKMYRFSDVVLDRDSMMLLKDGRVIAETNYLQPDSVVRDLRVRPDDLIRPRAQHPVAACFDHWNTNYFHWTAHTIPALQAILRSNPGNDIGLLLPRSTPLQSATLDLIGASTLPAVHTEPGQQYLLPQVEYYDYAVGSADFAISGLSRAAYSRMVAAARPGPPDDDKLYIDRAGSSNRKVPNESALSEACRRRGYRAVRSEDYSLDEQIRLFHGAALVVGLHGAGLSNIAYCRPGTVVYELSPEHYQNPCFLAMAMQGELRYWCDMFPTGVQAQDHTSAWQVDIDIDHVMLRLDELEGLL